MFCPTCRQERLGGFSACVVCGAVLTKRAREDVLEDLGHVRFVLTDMGKWADSEVPVSARKYVRGRYQQMERVLRTVLETPDGEIPEVRSWQVASAPAPAPAPKVDAPAAAFDSAQSASEKPFDSAQGERSSAEETTSEEDAAPPIAPLLPAFDIPHTPSADEQVVEEASKWSEVWKPFLYERIGWFIGAFLILAGSFYFVAVSWSGMSALMQTLVVFGLTAGYSAAFSVGGALLGRRENFDSAGKVLMLIGSAVAPLANLAFQTTGVQLAVGIPLSLGWAALAAVLFGVAAKAIDEKTQRPMQLLMLVAAANMALAPLAAAFGPAMLWLNVVPLVLINRVWKNDDERSGEAAWFAVCAPLYLVALFSIRLHVALAHGAALPPVATYAPFASLLLMNSLQLRKLATNRAADVLGVAVVTAQVGLLFASGFGYPPALFICCALLGVTTWQLSRGENLRRTGWLYGTYAAAQLAYQTCGQLVPGLLKALIVQAKAALGLAESAPLPFNFDSVVALPFVIAGAILAVRLLNRKEARAHAVAEVLLRSTAGAALLFTAVSFAGRDLRAALWSVPVFALMCLGLGQWLSRAYLVITGAFLLVTVPFFTFGMFGPGAAGVVTGVAALLLALFSVIQTRETRGSVSFAAGLLAGSAIAIGWLAAPPHLLGVISVALGGLAGLLIARNLEQRALFSLSTAVLVSAVPLFFLSFHPEAAPFSLAVAGLALALLTARDERSRALTPVVFAVALVAPAWAWVIQQSTPSMFTLLAPVLVIGGLSLLEVSRRDVTVRPFGAVLLGLALFPTMSAFATFPFATPLVSAALLSAAALASALLSSSKENEATSIALALTVVVGALFAAGLAFVHGGWEPVLLTASLAVLLTARALHPSFSVPLAALMAVVVPGDKGHTFAILAEAVALTLIALVPLNPRLHEVLFGKKRIATAASLSSAFLLVICAVKNEPFPNLVHLAVYATLPLVWVRASRRSWMALFLAPLMALFLNDNGGFNRWMTAVPFAVALATRLVGQVVAVRQLVTEGDEKRTRRMQGFALAGLGAVALVLLTQLGVSNDVREESTLVLLSIAAGFVAAGGAPLWARLLAATVVSAVVPQARPLLMPALMVVAYLAHHLPKQTHAVLGAPEDKLSPALISLIAVGVTCVPWLSGWPTNADMLLTAASVLAASVLLRQSWMIPVSLVLAASASLGLLPMEQRWLIGGVSLEAFAIVGLFGALCSALLANEERNETAQGFSQLLGPGFEGDLHLPMWFSGLLSASAAVVLSFAEVGAGTLPPLVALMLFAAVGLLLVTKDRVQTVLATVLGSALIIAAVPFVWVPVSLAAFGLALALAGGWFEGELDTADALHHAGWVTAAASVLFCRSLHHIATPLCFALIAATAWTMVWRRREREVLGWAASLLFGHVLFFHLGVVLSTGKPPQYIFPYVSMLSAVLAAVVASFAGEKVRRGLLLTFAGIALVEILCGVLLLPLGSTEVAMREALVAAVGMGVLVVTLVRHAVKHDDVAAAYFAQVALLMGYLAMRVHGMTPHALGTNDAVAALVGGALFSGLYVWARRQDEAHVFLKPAWIGAVGLPLLGLFVAPWGSPMVVACLLMGHAAHFAVASRLTDNRRGASLLATSAFNAALVFMWLGTGFGRPQYYVIPAALSMLVLVRAFKNDFSAEVEARLRAVAVTAIYLAAAWPLLFENTWQMLLCALICVVGVAVGVAMRIRSYVYLGTGFLVSSIVANLIRFGVRDPRLGALFLSLLGLLIVGFMIYLTAQRADVLRRYQRVRNMLQTWES